MFENLVLEISLNEYRDDYTFSEPLYSPVLISSTCIFQWHLQLDSFPMFVDTSVTPLIVKQLQEAE